MVGKGSEAAARMVAAGRVMGAAVVVWVATGAAVARAQQCLSFGSCCCLCGWSLQQAAERTAAQPSMPSSLGVQQGKHEQQGCLDNAG